jgi:hypothetical protein
VLRQAKGPEARTNVCDLHASLQCARYFPILQETHGMAWKRDFRAGRQAGKILSACRLTLTRTIDRSVDQSINQSINNGIVAMSFFAQDGSVTTVLHCIHTQSSTSVFACTAHVRPALTCVAPRAFLIRTSQTLLRCAGAGARVLDDRSTLCTFLRIAMLRSP